MSVVKFYQPSGRRITQRDIAEMVGVSHVTVSQVLHQQNGSRVGPETREEILRVARALGYQPRGMTTRTVALVVKPNTLWHDVTTSILIAADEVLHQQGYRMSISTLGVDSLDAADELFSSKRVDGVIFTDWCPKRADVFFSISTPWVLLAEANDLPHTMNQVGMDTAQTARRMTEYLIDKGHERICVVTGRAGVGYHERLKTGIYAAARDAKLPKENIVVLHTTEETEMEELLLPLLGGNKRPTAIITGSPGGANITLNRLQRNGFRVPEDISVVSLIDSPRLTHLKPMVTASTASGRETVECAVHMLIQAIREPGTPPTKKFIAGEIIERDSVRAL